MSRAVTEPDFLRNTCTSYDAAAVGYAERFRDELAARPLDRAMPASDDPWVPWPACSTRTQAGRAPAAAVLDAGNYRVPEA